MSGGMPIGYTNCARSRPTFYHVAEDAMDYDTDKIDDMILALPWLTVHDEGRAWKGHDWDAMDRLFQKGYIFDPKNKTKSVVFTEEGLQRSEELFKRYFSR
jgi:hypothetical protein